MSQNYQALEGELSIRGQGETTQSGQVNAAAIVGGYDAENAAEDVTAGEPTYISDPTSADEQFGDSELARHASVVSANGVGTIYGVPVPETEATESISSSTSTTLSEFPVFDPTLHPEHEIAITDTDSGEDLDVNVVHEGEPSTPETENTANVNPSNGVVEIDESGNYDITYTHGDYQSAIDTAVDLNVRSVITLTEASNVKAMLVSSLSDVAQDFDFKRAYVGAQPELGPTDIADYTPDQQDWRLVEVAPARGTGAGVTVRTCAAVGGFMTSQPIGPDGSGLYDDVNGLTGLNTSYRSSDLRDVEQLTTLTRNGVIGTADTTGTNEQFQPIYATEIIDQLALDLFEPCREYAGGPQDPGDLETELEVVCQRASNGSPPLLGFGEDRDQNPYDVNVGLGSDSTVAEAGVTIVPYPIAETVNLSLTVSDGFVQFGGASA